MNIVIDVFNERVSKTPHTLWYVLSYSDKYKYMNIIDAIRTNNIKKLNKNLRLFASNIQIIVN